MTVIVPCFNEREYIAVFLLGLNDQSALANFEVVLADGMSNDGTVQEIERIRNSLRYNLRVIRNPERIVSTGLNAAAEVARGKFLVRLDVHSNYDRNYISHCCEVLGANPDVMCVGGAWRPADAKDAMQMGISRAFSSRIGSGGAKSRNVEYTGRADTVYLGAWRREQFSELGGFDPKLVRNQDDELCLRIIRSGGQVWQDRRIVSFYNVRAKISQVYRQFFQYGLWKTDVMRKHKLPAAGRHLMPALFVCVVLAVSLSGLVGLIPIWISFIPVCSYLLIILVVSIFEWRRTPMNMLAGVNFCLAVVAMHTGYGVGFLSGLLASPSSRTNKSKLKQISR